MPTKVHIIRRKTGARGGSAYMMVCGKYWVSSHSKKGANPHYMRNLNAIAKQVRSGRITTKAEARDLIRTL